MAVRGPCTADEQTTLWRMSELIKLDSSQLHDSGETNWSEWYKAEQQMLFLWVVHIQLA